MVSANSVDKIYMVVSVRVNDGKPYNIFYVEVGNEHEFNKDDISRCATLLKSFSNNFNRGYIAKNGANWAICADKCIDFEAKSVNSLQLAQEIFDCKYNNGYDMVEMDKSAALTINEQQFVKSLARLVHKFVKMSQIDVEDIVARGERVNQELSK